MAMTKKEQAMWQCLQDRLRIAIAMRFTERVKPDVPPPKSSDPFGKLTSGFLFNSHRSYERVVPACSSCSFHSFGRNDKTDSQNAKSLYSTELLAWKALRNELEDRFAKELSQVDLEIEKLTGGELK